MKYIEEKALNLQHLFRSFVYTSVLLLFILSGILVFSIFWIQKDIHNSETKRTSDILGNAFLQQGRPEIVTLLEFSQSGKHLAPLQQAQEDNANLQIYSIQANTFSSEKSAVSYYSELLATFTEYDSEYSLRVEKIGNYFTVRIGTFSNKSSAKQAQKIISSVLGKTVILQTHIDPNRIITSNIKPLARTTREVSMNQNFKDLYVKVDTHLQTLLRLTDISTVNVFSSNGTIIYSTNASLTNKNQPISSNLKDVLSGSQNAFFSPNDWLKNLSVTNRTSLDIGDTEYIVPIKNSLNKIIGAYQVFYGASKYHRDAKDQITRLAILFFVMMAAIISFFILLVRFNVQKINKTHEDLLELSITDNLTGLHDRRQVFKHLEKEFKRLNNSKGRKEDIKSIGCMVAEIDHLKTINDQYGYQTGDQILQLVSKRILDTLRPYDVAGRSGGDVFIIVLPNTSLNDTKKAAERIRKNVRTARPESIEKNHTISLSIGIACLTDFDTSVDDAVKRAETSMQKAKNSGRDRVCWDETLEI